jgi:hypothetical protein
LKIENLKLESETVTPSPFFAILVWGGLWGIFEATVGYLLHLLPFSVGWLVWYPVACFFMVNVYRKTGRVRDILYVGILAACIKLLNLFMPVRVDRVINPAVSILLEALSMAIVAFGLNRFFRSKKKSPAAKAIAVFCMNTGWRALYALYLLLLAPNWMREISVISSGEALVTFFITHNFFTSLVLFAGYLMLGLILRPVEAAEERLSSAFSAFPQRAMLPAKTAVALCLVAGSAALQMLL